MLKFTFQKDDYLLLLCWEQMVGEGAGGGGTREEDEAGVQEGRVPRARAGKQMCDLFWTLSL